MQAGDIPNKLAPPPKNTKGVSSKHILKTRTRGDKALSHPSQSHRTSNAIPILGIPPRIVDIKPSPKL